LARLTYGIVAAALAALIAGFFVKTSTLPLILSIGFSAAATVLILIGWGRRLRLEQEHGAPEPAEEEVEEIDFIELGVDELQDEPYRPPARERPVREPRRVRRAPRIAADAVVELPEDAELTYEIPAVADEPPPRRRKPKPTPKPKPRPPARRRAQTRVVVVPGRGRYHTHSCRFAARDDAVEMTVATARRRGYEACSVCSPDESGFTPL